jgi:hypothetical protein
VSLFAYGTLMTADGLRGVLGARADRLVFRRARLFGWRRIWNGERPQWDGAILNVEPHDGAEVVGVLVEGLSPEDWMRLDEQERSHLPRESVGVALEDGQRVPAQLYRQRRPAGAARPSVRYQQVVIERARQAGAAVLESLVRDSVDASGGRLALPRLAS